MHLLLHAGQFLRGSHTGSHVSHVGLSLPGGGLREPPILRLEDDALNLKDVGMMR